MSIFTVKFWKRAIELAVRTAAQSVVAAVPTSALTDVGVWELALTYGGFMVALSIFTSLASSTVTGEAAPTVVK